MSFVCERRLNLNVKAEDQEREQRTDGGEQRILHVKPESGCVSTENVYVSAGSGYGKADLP